MLILVLLIYIYLLVLSAFPRSFGCTKLYNTVVILAQSLCCNDGYCYSIIVILIACAIKLCLPVAFWLLVVGLNKTT